MKIIVIYYSKTGFTEKYAKIISKELNCKLINYEDIKKENLINYDLVIFGSRIIAGKISKLKNIINRKNIKNLILFTTGSTPNEAKNVQEEMWKSNLNEEQINKIPHFHMQSGMNIDSLPFIEKAMLKMAKKMIQSKKNKTTEDLEFEKAISNTFDISNKKYTKELIDYVKTKKITHGEQNEI